jgi:hypothetical protein
LNNKKEYLFKRMTNLQACDSLLPPHILHPTRRRTLCDPCPLLFCKAELILQNDTAKDVPSGKEVKRQVIVRAVINSITVRCYCKQRSSVGFCCLEKGRNILGGVNYQS